MPYFISISGIAILLLISYTGSPRGWFLKPCGWLSRIMHTFGGFFVAMFISEYFGKELLAQAGVLKYFIIIAGSTALVGVFWEIAEYIFGIYKFKKSGTKKYITEIKDTIEDLFLDIVGAGIWILLLVL